MPDADDRHADPAAEQHRLARDPDKTDGLSREKMGERDGGSGAARDRSGGKPYTTESENYSEGPGHRPDHPTERAEAQVPPRR